MPQPSGAPFVAETLQRQKQRIAELEAVIMWHSRTHDLPALDVHVIGIDDDGDVAFWTRTTDGWYVSEKCGNVGHRDARGPAVWTHIPEIN